MRARIAFLFFALAVAACRPEYAPATRDQRWVETCGDVQPLGAGHDVVPPILLERVEPSWPRDRQRGVIVVETVLTDDGRVCAARIARGSAEDVNHAVLEAVRHWRFTPVRLNGQPRFAFFHVSVEVN